MAWCEQSCEKLTSPESTEGCECLECRLFRAEWEADMSRASVDALTQMLDAAEAERDQLRAEVASLKHSAEKETT